MYDYTICDGIAELETALRLVNENSWRIIAVTQYEFTYTVIFCRGGRWQKRG